MVAITGGRSCGGSFVSCEGPADAREGAAEAKRHSIAHDNVQRPSIGAPPTFPCQHYLPSNKVSEALENVAVKRSSVTGPPLAPPARHALQGAAPQSPRLSQHGPTRSSLAPPQPTSEADQAAGAPRNCSARDCEEASDAPASEHAPAELHLDPVECIPYSELEFTEHLGSGEFGTVCRGRFRDEEVAIKQLFWDNTMREDVVMQDLAKEVESFRHLRHKRLVTFIGACLEIPHPCIVTEYMPGGSLHHLLHVRKLQLPLLHAINMCMQLADGVRYLHSQNPVVVHRDLKTQNVVLDLNLNVKLCDFGLTESMERTHISKKNNGGSPRYMAPELFDCKTKITEKVDLWAMGCIFIEIFGGTLPYESINSLADLTRELLVHKRPPSLPGQIPDDLKPIISGCHNFDHRSRPSADQVFEQLAECKRHMRQVGAIPDATTSKAACRSSEASARSRRSRTAGAGA